jgi:DNA-directed RNA polymerase subunit RPC12/RpoP
MHVHYRSMTHYKTIYKCSQCGATSYQPVIGRDATGALMPTGVLRCTGCRVTFTDPKDWWGHNGSAQQTPDTNSPQAHPATSS